jgi:hypothetical protein
VTRDEVARLAQRIAVRWLEILDARYPNDPEARRQALVLLAEHLDDAKGGEG